MMDYLIVSALIVEVLLLSRLDRRLFGTWFTPFNLLGWPYMFIAVLAFLFAPSLGFVPLYTPSILIWFVGLLFFWGTGFVMSLVFSYHTESCSPGEPSQSDDSAARLATRISIGVMPVLAFNLYKAQASTGGWSQIGTYDFKLAYEHGLAAHALQFTLPLCIFLMGSYRRGRRLRLLTILCLLIFLFCSQVKGTILSSIIAALIFKTMREQSHFPVKRIVVGIVCSYLLFNAVYLAGISIVNPSVLTDAQTYVYFARHYMHYLWAGPLAFSEALRANVGFIGGPWYLLFAPFINIYRAISGSGPILIAGGPLELGMNIDPSNIIPDGGTNVYTMFGTLYYYLGSFGAVLLVIVLSAVCYGLLLLCKSHHDDWLLVLYCLIGSWLVFGFFEYYFASLGFPECIIFCLFLSALSKCKPEQPCGAIRHFAPHAP
jgi:oligosaccharide repeat unit polymerase